MKFNLTKEEEINIQFVPIVDGLEQIEEAIPKPANRFIPEWWKDIPRIHGEATIESHIGGNVKDCPSFPTFFSQGFIIPMWCDVILSYDDSEKIWNWRTPDSSFPWTAHSNDQFLDHVPFKFLGDKAYFVFKPLCPWNIITPPGWSVLQLPLFYHYENDWTVLPGIVDTDYHHEVNQQFLFFHKKKEILIRRGTPIAQYIPFQRTKTTMTLEKDEGEIAKKLKYFRLMMSTKFMGDRRYLKLRRSPYYEKGKENE